MSSELGGKGGRTGLVTSSGGRPRALSKLEGNQAILASLKERGMQLGGVEVETLGGFGLVQVELLMPMSASKRMVPTRMASWR